MTGVTGSQQTLEGLAARQNCVYCTPFGQTLSLGPAEVLELLSAIEVCQVC